MIFGMHVQLPTTQPTITFGAQRLWDTGTRWNQIETSRGIYDWSVFDAWLAKANVPLLYTFGGTPAWAAADKSLPPIDMAMWREYVHSVVTRAEGRIEAYEIWNEPNLTKFYSGTMAQMVEMSRIAYEVIKTADKGHQALVVSPSPTFSSTYNVPAGANGTDCAVWFKDYLDAGGGQYFDVAAYHGYPDRANPEGSSLAKINGMQATLAAHSLTKELWDTEASWGTEDKYPDLYLQAAMVGKLYLLKAPKVARFYWYGYDYVPWGTLVGKPAAIAYQEVQKWMANAVTAPAALANGVWSVGIGTKLAAWAQVPTIYKVPDGFTQYRDLAGNVVKLGPNPNRLIVLDPSPILLETA